jgi:hypothetical protein
MFQNSDGTTAVAVGDPVGYIADKSGNGINATQSTAASRPALYSPYSGAYGIYYDYVDDSLTLTLDAGTYSFAAAAPSANGIMYTEFTDSYVHAGGALTLPRTGVSGFIAVDRALTAQEKVNIATYFRASNYEIGTNDIGVAGFAGFGQGICPAVPAGFTGNAGYDDIYNDEYGNYTYSDGSVMVWIPAFYYRIAHADNASYARYGVNSVDVVEYAAFADVATANSAGYALHRAFYDGGSIQQGFFVDKYQASNNAGTASSIKNGNPLSTNSAHNPIGGLTGTPANNYGGVFAAAKTRGTQFFPQMRYQFAALALLSLAHGQASNGTAACAWYSSTLATNFPKGCNNNALKDANDTSVIWESDGYSNCGKTGSAGFGGGAGNVFAKSTHNGQNCGVADLNGNVWEVGPGLTCVSGAINITAATKANPVQITAAAHGRTTGDIVQITSVGGMTQINDKLFTVTVVDVDNVTLDGVDGTAFGTYTSGGSLTYGTFYALNTSYAAKDLTGSNTLATDQWGATGVAAHSSALAMTLRTDYAQNGFDKCFGRSANQVLDEDTSGAGWMLSALGIPMAAGISDGTTGSNLFGADQIFQYVRNELCPVAGGTWAYSSSAGVWAVSLNFPRALSSATVGFRAASYL